MDVLTRTLAELEIGEARHCANLTMVPLLGGRSGTPDYRTLDEALASGRARVTELPGPRVPQLRFRNDGDLAVLLVEGEELQGAMQDRVLNLTILAPAERETAVPVTCVEAGRWSRRSTDFVPAPRAQYASARARKTESVSILFHQSSERVSDQSLIWRELDEKRQRFGCPPGTGAMADVFESVEEEVERFVRELRPTAGQAGAAFAVDGIVVGLDLFDYQDTLARLLPKLARSYGLDAVDARRGRPSPEARPEVRPGAVRALLDRVQAGERQSSPAFGEGEDVRLDGPGLTAAALVARDRVVHLSAFALEKRSGGSRGRTNVRRRPGS